MVKTRPRLTPIVLYCTTHVCMSMPSQNWPFRLKFIYRSRGQNFVTTVGRVLCTDIFCVVLPATSLFLAMFFMFLLFRCLYVLLVILLALWLCRMLSKGFRNPVCSCTLTLGQTIFVVRWILLKSPSGRRGALLSLWISQEHLSNLGSGTCAWVSWRAQDLRYVFQNTLGFCCIWAIWQINQLSWIQGLTFSAIMSYKTLFRASLCSS